MERKGPTKEGNGLPIPKKQDVGMMIKMGKATVIKKGAGMTSMRSAFWSSMNQFDALVDNVEEMIHDVRGEDEMTEAEVRKYKQFVEDSKKTSLFPL